MEILMDMLLQVIGFGFIPLLAILIAGGMVDIYQGLKEHYQFRDFKISEIKFKQNANNIVENFGFTRFNTNFCKH